MYRSSWGADPYLSKNNPNPRTATPKDPNQMALDDLRDEANRQGLLYYRQLRGQT